MFSYEFTFRSMTAAQSGRNVLLRAGLHPELRRAAQSLSRQGCSYALHLPAREGARAAGLLRSYQTAYSHIFRVYPDGRTEEAVL